MAEIPCFQHQKWIFVIKSNWKSVISSDSDCYLCTKSYSVEWFFVVAKTRLENRIFWPIFSQKSVQKCFLIFTNGTSLYHWNCLLYCIWDLKPPIVRLYMVQLLYFLVPTGALICTGFLCIWSRRSMVWNTTLDDVFSSLKTCFLIERGSLSKKLDFVLIRSKN